MLYGSETIRKEDIEGLEAFEIWISRKMTNISWMETITNEAVVKLVKVATMMLLDLSVDLV